MKLGEIQVLKVQREVPFGAYLGVDMETTEEVLLPKSQFPAALQVGDDVEVFVYKDSEDRWIATTKRPLLTVGQAGALEVVEKTHIGAFLNWGLEKDLFLPFKQQLVEVKAGEKYLVGVYIDKSDRLCATMKVYNVLSTAEGYNKNQTVKGVIYQIHPEFGAFVAVDGRYHGMIPNTEFAYGDYKVGDEIEARIRTIRPDGKLVLSLRRQAFQQMDKDAEVILAKLTQNGNKLALHDHSSPVEIKKVLNMSKASFKRAVGRLLKEGAIELSDTGITKRF